jgi:predicted short-subunit dehydrogenase-like oxidoreductase (DUF2520 family)
MEFTSACVVGAGRVGSAVAARLAERIPTRITGRELEVAEADLVIVCVPDRVIPEVAAEIPVGPWIAHTSGARTLDALDPHVRRFGLHPLQTFVPGGGPEQLDGAWAAVSGETDEARALGRQLAQTLGLTPFDLDDGARTLYHAGAAFASTYLVTLYRIASRLFEGAGAPPEALVPLMMRTIENGFQQTGPIVRGDWAVIDAHASALHDAHPELEPLYRVLAEATTP